MTNTPTNEVSTSDYYNNNIPFTKYNFTNPIVLLVAPVQLREISKEGSQRRPNDANSDSAEGDLPVFEPTAANVSAFVGQTVYLPCRVRNLGDKVVSRSNFLAKWNASYPSNLVISEDSTKKRREIMSVLYFLFLFY